MPRMLRRGRFKRRTTQPNSSGRSRHPLELYKSAHVVDRKFRNLQTVVGENFFLVSALSRASVSPRGLQPV